MHVVHLTASTFFGGPERQMLGLAQHLPSSYRCSFVSFAEGGRCEAFLQVVRSHGFAAQPLAIDFPAIRGTLRHLTHTLAELKPDVILTHSYKPNILGRLAANRLRIPAIAVSRGWTGENRKVRFYEWLDRWNLRRMSHVIAVSDGQAAKVRATGVAADRLSVIRNSARLASLQPADPDLGTEARLHRYFPADYPISHIVVSAGRLSPEKGFDVLVRAAAQVVPHVPHVGFLHFGDGVERPAIHTLIQSLGLANRFVLAGFTEQLDQLLPGADLVVLPSHTEGLPNVALEASCAEVAVVATAVGGTPEVIADGQTGLLVPPGDPVALSVAIRNLLGDDARRRAMGRAGRRKMQAEFTFAAQAQQYVDLLERFRHHPVLLHQRITCPRPLPPSRSPLPDEALLVSPNPVFARSGSASSSTP
jgi:glycosyltransferase involved in cell wall biosynthesis